MNMKNCDQTVPKYITGTWRHTISQFFTVNYTYGKAFVEILIIQIKTDYEVC